MTDYVCKNCGCKDIQVLMWANPNTDEIIDWYDDGFDHECFCNKCGELSEWITVEEYKELVKP